MVGLFVCLESGVFLVLVWFGLVLQMWSREWDSGQSGVYIERCGALNRMVGL